VQLRGGVMEHIYPERESKSLEFKSKLPNFHTLLKTCVAFANGTGGKIIIGIDDKTQKIVGVDEKTRDRVYDEFPNSLYDATSPSLLTEIYEKRLNNHSIMIIEIAPSMKKPVLLKSEGSPAGIYLRAGSNTRRATPEYVEELIRENKRILFDEEPVLASTDILSKNLLEEIFKHPSNDRLLSEKIIAPSHTHAKKYSPTVTGVLTFCETPEQYIQEAVIRCSRFSGIDGRNILQDEEIKGPLAKQVESSFQLIKSWLTRDYALLGTRLKGKTIVPEIALRETIINAVIHRKYWIPGAIKIALYDNRLEIFSPGNFPGLLDINCLGDGTTYLRNPTLAKIARRYGIVEKLGTGIKLVLESCKKAHLQPPEYIEGADSVKVVFNFLPMTDYTSSDEEKLLALFKFRKELRLSDVEKYMGVSRNTATRKLNKLIDKGKIVRQGRGPTVRYILIA
jgi:ATP-dependent DNA helicase RecG